MEARVQRALAVLELEAQHPSVQSASFLGNEGDQPAMIQLRLSTESFKTKTQTEHTQILMLKTEGEGFKVIQSPMQAVSAEVQASTTLHRGVWSVNFKVLADSKKRILEIVHSEKGVQTEVDVTDIHADFLTGEQWGEPQWLREGEGILVYVAECHPPNWKDDDKRELYHSPIHHPTTHG